MADSGSGLEGRVVLVTGASSGIGAAAAVRFGELGCKLVLVARSAAGLEGVAGRCREAGATAVTVLSHDLAVPGQCEAAVAGAVRQFGQLDVLVNSAGILMSGGVENLTGENYDLVMNINTRAAFLLTQAAVPHLLATRGNVIHVSSVTGIRAFPGVLGYCMSKAALDQLVRCAALELGGRGVRVNSVNPGVIVTDCHKRGGMEAEQYEQFLQHSTTTHALGRVGQPAEVADLIAFLASDRAAFITGQTIGIDGGRGVMCPR